MKHGHFLVVQLQLFLWNGGVFHKYSHFQILYCLTLPYCTSVACI